MSAATTVRKRPSDAELEKARQAVIDAARNYIVVYAVEDAGPAWSAQQQAVQALGAIEWLRSELPAISSNGGFGWDVEAARDSFRDQGYSQVRESYENQDDRAIAEDATCEHCGAHGMAYEAWRHKVIGGDGYGYRYQGGTHIMHCPTCGYWMEW